MYQDSTQIQILTNKVSDLKNSLDSIKYSNTVNQMQYELSDKQNIITQIDDFYDSAWLKLIIVISILGILVPIIAQYFQRKNLKDLTSFIVDQMKNTLESEVKELKSINQTKLDNTLEIINKEFDILESKYNSLNSLSEASLYFLQGASLAKDGEFNDSTQDFIKSAYYLLDTEKTSRIEPTFDNICFALDRTHNLREVNENLVKNLNKDLEEIILYFKTHKYYPIYKVQLKNIIIRIEEIKNGG